MTIFHQRSKLSVQRQLGVHAPLRYAIRVKLPTLGRVPLFSDNLLAAISFGLLASGFVPLSADLGKKANSLGRFSWLWETPLMTWASWGASRGTTTISIHKVLAPIDNPKPSGRSNHSSSDRPPPEHLLPHNHPAQSHQASVEEALLPLGLLQHSVPPRSTVASDFSISFSLSFLWKNGQLAVEFLLAPSIVLRSYSVAKHIEPEALACLL